MYTSKIAKLIDNAIEECLAYGRGRIDTPDLTVIADWDENEKDIEINLIQRGVTVATLRETNADELY